MYTSVRNGPEVPPGEAEPEDAARGRKRLAGVSGTVVAMGMVSFLTDASAEMVTAVLPLFLILQIGLTPLQYGVVDGVYQGVTVLVRPLRGAARGERPHRRVDVVAVRRRAHAAGPGRRLAVGRAPLGGLAQTDSFLRSAATCPVALTL